MSRAIDFIKLMEEAESDFSFKQWDHPAHKQLDSAEVPNYFVQDGAIADQIIQMGKHSVLSLADHPLSKKGDVLYGRNKEGVKFLFMLQRKYPDKIKEIKAGESI